MKQLVPGEFTNSDRSTLPLTSLSDRQTQGGPSFLSELCLKLSAETWSDLLHVFQNVHGMDCARLLTNCSFQSSPASSSRTSRLTHEAKSTLQGGLSGGTFFFKIFFFLLALVNVMSVAFIYLSHTAPRSGWFSRHVWANSDRSFVGHGWFVRRPWSTTMAFHVAFVSSVAAKFARHGSQLPRCIAKTSDRWKRPWQILRTLSKLVAGDSAVEHTNMLGFFQQATRRMTHRRVIRRDRLQHVIVLYFQMYPKRMQNCICFVTSLSAYPRITCRFFCLFLPVSAVSCSESVLPLPAHTVE